MSDPTAGWWLIACPMDEDLEQAVNASIARNIATARHLESLRPPDPPKDLIMTAETFAEHKAKAQVIIDRLHARGQSYAEGPRGE